MKTFMNMRIGARLTLLITTVVVAVFALTIVVTMVRVNALAADDARQIAIETARGVGKSVEAAMDLPMDDARTLANIFESAATVDGMKLTRRKANMMLKYFIEKNTAFPDVWAVFEPNAFDGNDANFKGDAGTDQTGRFIPTWSRDKDGVGLVEANKDYETAGPGDYYQVPKTRKRESVIDPYPYTLDGKQVLLSSFAVPVLDRQGKFLGVMGVDLDLTSVQVMVAGLHVGQYRNTSVNLMAAGGQIAASSSPDYVGKPIEQTSSEKGYVDGMRKGEQFQMQRFSRTLNGAVVSVGVPVEIGVSGQKWMVNVNVSLAEAMAAGHRLVLMLLALAAAAVAVLVLLVVLISRSISRPLGKGVEFARQIAQGNLTATINVGSPWGRDRPAGRGAEDHDRQPAQPRAADPGRGRPACLQLRGAFQHGTAALRGGAEPGLHAWRRPRLRGGAHCFRGAGLGARAVAGQRRTQTSPMEQMMRSVERGIGRPWRRWRPAPASSVEKAQQGARSVKQAVEAIKDISESSEKIAGIVERDLRHRRPDKPAGAERRHRGGQGRGARARIRRRGRRSEQAGRAQRQLHEGNRRVDQGERSARCARAWSSPRGRGCRWRRSSRAR